MIAIITIRSEKDVYGDDTVKVSRVKTAIVRGENRKDIRRNARLLHHEMGRDNFRVVDTQYFFNPLEQIRDSERAAFLVGGE